MNKTGNSAYSAHRAHLLAIQTIDYAGAPERAPRERNPSETWGVKFRLAEKRLVKVTEENEMRRTTCEESQSSMEQKSEDLLLERCARRKDDRALRIGCAARSHKSNASSEGDGSSKRIDLPRRSLRAGALQSRPHPRRRADRHFQASAEVRGDQRDRPGALDSGGPRGHSRRQDELDWALESSLSRLSLR